MTLRELQYRLTAQDRITGKLRQVSSAGNKVDRSLGSVNNKLSKLQMGINGAAASVPGLSRGLSLLTNPYALGLGGIALLTVGLDKATNAAANFNTEFRDLFNLNLGKSLAQMGTLQANVLQTAYKYGFDPSKTSKAYYDIQSITGKYGDEVQKIVAKTGMFSRVMRSDFTGTIAGTAQAMDIYKLHASQLDKYLASLNATVVVGKTNFDELTRVQVRFANAAAAQGQGYDNANRLFAAFSKLSDSIDIAARYTKIAFQDLTKKSTLDGFKKIGINVFDAQGKMRGLDKIVEDLVPKLKGMNDITYARFKESIGGSIGVNALLDMTRNKAEAVVKSFKEFDKTKFNMNDALKEALKDANFLHETLQNKLKVDIIRLGKLTLPWKVWWIEFKIEFADKFNTWLKGVNKVKKEIVGQNVYTAMQNYQQRLNNADKLPQDKFNKTINDIYGKIGFERNRIKQFGYNDTNKGYVKYGKDYNVTWVEGKKQVQEFYNERYAYINAYKKLLGKFYEYRNNPGVNPFRKSDSGKNPDTKTTNYEAGLNNISGGGSKPTNVNVTIGKLNENININSTTITEATAEIEKKMTELLVRSVAGAEQIIASN